MKVLSRSAASLTVLGGLVFLPFLSHDLAPAVDISEQMIVRAPRIAEPVPDWPKRVVSMLAKRGVPMDRSQLVATLEAVQQASRRDGIHPMAILAIIQVESRFDPQATSPDGAMGLMQISAATGRALAEQMGIPWTSDDQLFDPVTNVLLGTRYLASLLEQFQGDMDAALAAFNCGPGRVAARLGRTGQVPLRYSDRVWDALFALRSAALI